MKATVLAILMAGALAVAAGAADPTPYDAEKAPWPCWRGPYANGSAPEQGIRLIDDLSKAKLVWVSDQPIPGAYMSYGGVPYWTGGHSSPIIAEGRVYIAYSCPPGRTTYEFTEEDLKYRTRGNRQPYPPDKTGDDVVHCFDAATGRTLWRQVFSRKGRTALGEGWHLTVCYADGRIFAPGSAGAIYCIDAASGEPIWEGRVEPRSSDPTAGRHSSHCGTPQVADGVVVLGHGPLHGFDAATGKPLWVGPSVPRGHAPVVWRHQGKDYFIVGNTSGAMLITPRDGKIQWTAPPGEGRMHCGSAFAVAGDFMVVLGWGGSGVGAGGREFAGGPTCYRISPSGCEKVWSCPISIRGGALFESPTIHRGRVYVSLIRSPADPPRSKNNCLACLDLASGKVLATGKYEQRLFPGYSMVAAEGRLLPAPGAMVEAGTLTLLGTSANWKYGRTAVATSFGYADGLLYKRTEEGSIRDTFPNRSESRLVCYDLRAR